MLRNVSLEDISDGRLYTENDLVRVDTNSCKGCQTVCCQNMGSTIVIDPYDCYKLTTGLGKTFEQLTMNELELNVVDGLVVYDKVIEKRLMAELPFMATENIMMDAVKAGGDRQELHEKIRQLSMEAGKNVKQEGKENNLLELIAADDEFPMTLPELQALMEPSRYTGRSASQVEEFIQEIVQPILDENQEILGMKSEINV